MSRERKKSRPVSFRVPVEEWGAVVAAAEQAGCSVGMWAAKVVREAAEHVQQPPVYTGKWGIEASLPPEPDDLPTTPLLNRAFGGTGTVIVDGVDITIIPPQISTQSDETGHEGVPEHGETPADTPNKPYTATESAETGEIGTDDDRQARISRLRAAQLTEEPF